MFDHLLDAVRACLRALEPADKIVSFAFEAVSESGRKVAIAERPKAAGPAPEVPGILHDPDYRWWNWYGQEFRLTPTQAACAGVLWQAYLAGTPEMTRLRVLEQANSARSRLDDVFRDHLGRVNPAWGAMIVPGERGMVRLGIRPAGAQENAQ